MSNLPPVIGRVRRIRKYVQDDTFLLTYGDGLSDVNIQAAGADVQASASFDFSDAVLDARLMLNGVASAPNTQSSAQRPAVLIALKGALQSPQRTVDISLLTSWLTLRAVEQQSKQIDAMERAARDAAMQSNPAAAIPNRSISTPVPNLSDVPGTEPNTSGNPGAQPPALPPPVDIPAAKPPVAPRADGGAAPVRNESRPRGLIGAQN